MLATTPSFESLDWTTVGLTLGGLLLIVLALIAEHMLKSRKDSKKSHGSPCGGNRQGRGNPSVILLHNAPLP